MAAFNNIFQESFAMCCNSHVPFRLLIQHRYIICIPATRQSDTDYLFIADDKCLWDAFCPILCRDEILGFLLLGIRLTGYRTMDQEQSLNCSMYPVIVSNEFEYDPDALICRWFNRYPIWGWWNISADESIAVSIKCLRRRWNKSVKLISIIFQLKV